MFAFMKVCCPYSSHCVPAEHSLVTFSEVNAFSNDRVWHKREANTRFPRRMKSRTIFLSALGTESISVRHIFGFDYSHLESGTCITQVHTIHIVLVSIFKTHSYIHWLASHNFLRKTERERACRRMPMIPEK